MHCVFCMFQDGCQTPQQGEPHRSLTELIWSAIAIILIDNLIYKFAFRSDSGQPKAQLASGMGSLLTDPGYCETKFCTFCNFFTSGQCGDARGLSCDRREQVDHQQVDHDLCPVEQVALRHQEDAETQSVAKYKYILSLPDLFP